MNRFLSTVLPSKQSFLTLPDNPLVPLTRIVARARIHRRCLRIPATDQPVSTGHGPRAIVAPRLMMKARAY